MDRKVFFALAAFAVSLFVLWLVFAIVSPFLRALGWAAVIGVLTFPLYQRLLRRCGGRSTLAAGLMTPAVVLTLVLPVTALMVVLTQELTEVTLRLQEASATGQLIDLKQLRNLPWMAPLLERLQPLIARFNLDVAEMVRPLLEKLTQFAISYSTAIVKNFFTFFIKLILLVVTLFFIYRDGEHFVQQFWSVVPVDRASKELLASTVKRVLGAVVYGIFLTCLLQGVLGGLGFWFTGLPSPVLFGALMVLSAPIPVVGTALFWLPGAGYLFLQGDAMGAGLLVAWGALAISGVDNFIRPLFISGWGKVPILVVALGALGGLVSFGLLGVITGPLILSLSLELFAIYKERLFPQSENGAESKEGRDEHGQG